MFLIPCTWCMQLYTVHGGVVLLCLVFRHLSFPLIIITCISTKVMTLQKIKQWNFWKHTMKNVYLPKINILLQSAFMLQWLHNNFGNFVSVLTCLIKKNTKSVCRFENPILGFPNEMHHELQANIVADINKIASFNSKSKSSGPVRPEQRGIEWSHWI